MNELEFLIDVAYLSAQAAYSAMNVPLDQLSLPTGYTPVGSIDANPRAAAALKAQANPDQQRLSNHMLAESNIFGLVAWNDAASTAIVAIRGTACLMDWIDDVEALLLPFAPFPPAGPVHMGFLVVYQHVRDSVQTLLGQCAGVQRIVITGHSLGGALAILCALDVLKNYGLTLVPEVHTFAGPLVGGPHFAGQFDALIPICNRVVNFGDLVPHVPLPPLYQHVGQPIVVHGGFRLTDPAYAHHLSTYLEGLHQLPNAPDAPYPAAPTSTAAVSAAAVAGAQAVVIAAVAGAAAVAASAANAEQAAEQIPVCPESVSV